MEKHRNYWLLAQKVFKLDVRYCLSDRNKEKEVVMCVVYRGR